MHPTTCALHILALLPVASEVALASFTRAGRRGGTGRDAGSLVFLRAAILAGVLAAILLPVFAALLRRIRGEDAVLLGASGEK